VLIESEARPSLEFDASLADSWGPAIRERRLVQVEPRLEFVTLTLQVKCWGMNICRFLEP
jgi:hypothetical protein